VDFPLRILTANLYNGRARPDALRAVINEVDPDVMAVQELSPNAADVMVDVFPFGLFDPREDTKGMALALRRPGVVERVPFGPRSMLRVLLDPAYWPGLGRPVEVVNAHLHNPLSGPPLKARATRRHQLAALEELLGEPGPARVLVGDFNSSPLWPAYRHLRALATDAAVAAGTTQATWSLWPWSPRFLRIDHAFVQHLTPTATTTVRIKGTDHSALVVDLDVPEK
jgi:endonuclease/exonuclease/phosphatase family metal-dependent hydrolase